MYAMALSGIIPGTITDSIGELTLPLPFYAQSHTLGVNVILTFESVDKILRCDQ